MKIKKEKLPTHPCPECMAATSNPHSCDWCIAWRFNLGYSYLYTSSFTSARKFAKHGSYYE